VVLATLVAMDALMRLQLNDSKSVQQWNKRRKKAKELVAVVPVIPKPLDGGSPKSIKDNNTIVPIQSGDCSSWVHHTIRWSASVM
jgi:small nuclear ribonucleoprotein (snRNP)-like protein